MKYQALITFEEPKTPDSNTQLTNILAKALSMLLEHNPAMKQELITLLQSNQNE